MVAKLVPEEDDDDGDNGDYDSDNYEQDMQYLLYYCFFHTNRHLFCFLRLLNSENSGARSQKCGGFKTEVYQRRLCGAILQQRWLRKE